jgi:uracil phosphoribosyltransferase
MSGEQPVTTSEDRPRVHVVDHPLVQHKLSLLRHTETGSKLFRELVRELAMFEAYEATRGFELVEAAVSTPLAEATAQVLAGKKVALVPILRAGLGMVDGVLELIPAARVGHVGLYRDPDTLQPVEYYAKLPEDIAERDVLILDPMLATGGSAAAAVQYLRARGARDIKLLVIIAAPEGVEAVLEADPAVEVYTCAIDSHLNDHGYIIPGLGDAGDRLFGTK